MNNGTGLFSMKERIEKLKGKIKINSNHNEGTVLVIKLPKESSINAKIRLLLADDHNILRQGLIDILERYDDFCIVAEAEDGYSMINKYFAFNPDVVLCDIEMPG